MIVKDVYEMIIKSSEQIKQRMKYLYWKKDMKELKSFSNKRWVLVDSLKKDYVLKKELIDFLDEISEGNEESIVEQDINDSEYKGFNEAVDEIREKFGEATTGSGVKGKFGCSGAPPKFKPVVAPKKD